MLTNDATICHNDSGRNENVAGSEITIADDVESFWLSDTGSAAQVDAPEDAGSDADGMSVVRRGKHALTYSHLTFETAATVRTLLYARQSPARGACFSTQQTRRLS